MFRPYVVFVTLGSVFLVAGLIPFIRFLILAVTDPKGSHIQSLIFGTAMIVVALLSFALVIISDLLRTNRILLEDQLERIKEIQYGTYEDTE
jgi:hypothetical protein